MRALLADVRFAFRLFAKHPGATAIAIVSLALATGPNAALFSLIDRLFIQGAAVDSPERLIGIYPATSEGKQSFSYPDYSDVAAQTTAFSHVVTWTRSLMPLSTDGHEESCPGNAVPANYFTGLGIRPAIGRLLAPDTDERPQGETPAVISYSLWQRRFGGRHDVIGRTVLVLGKTLVIVGVAQEDFRGLDFHLPTDVWVPFGRMRGFERRDAGQFETVLGRLRPGATQTQAQAELDVIGRRLRGSYPATNKDRRFVAYSYAKDQAFRGLLFGGVLLGLVSLVLLVACANVAGLLLAQAEERRREVAVRLSLGAGRWRLVRQLLTESLLLGLMGAAGGLLLAVWLLRLNLLPPMAVSLDYGVQLNARVFSYAILLSAFTAVLFGLVPALHATRRDLAIALKSERAEPPRRWRRYTFRNALVVGQIAVSQFLLISTALWIRSYLQVSALHPGFDSNGAVLLAQLAPTAGKAPRPEALGAAIARVRSLPGVVEVSSAANIPLSGSGGGMKQNVRLPGATEEQPIRNNFVGPRYFAVLGTKLLRGRDFDVRDQAAGGKSIIVNEALARRLSPGLDVVGRWLRVEGADREIIGIVENGRYGQLRDEIEPFLFLPSPGAGILTIRTAGEPARMSDAVRRAVTETGPELRVLNFTTLAENMRFATYADRTGASLLASLGLLGIVLSAVGLYGVVARAVSRRTQEIGIRMAIGAEPRKILRLVLGQGLGLFAAGALIGLAAAILTAVAASKLLFGIGPADPLSYLAGTAVVFVIALAASHVPARRAIRIDPATALRAE